MSLQTLLQLVGDFQMFISSDLEIRGNTLMNETYANFK